MAWRPKTKLTDAERLRKVQYDGEYEFAVHELSDPYYSKKHTSGTSIEEDTRYREAKVKLWADEQARRIVVGLYEEYDEAAELETAVERFLFEAHEVIDRIRELRGLTWKQILTALRNKIDKRLEQL